MGLFDRLSGRQKESTSPGNLDNTSSSSMKDRRSIPATEIDRMQRVVVSEKFRKKIYRKYYAGYLEIPYISQDRELNTNWSKQAEMFSGQIVEKKMMTRYADGLLPGHVYMLYWLNKYSSKRRIPSYFEYKYGIDFCKEKSFLLDEGFLGSDGKPTKIGLAAIERHKGIIEEQSPAPKKSGPPSRSCP